MIRHLDRFLEIKNQKKCIKQEPGDPSNSRYFNRQPLQLICSLASINPVVKVLIWKINKTREANLLIVGFVNINRRGFKEFYDKMA